MIIHRKLCRTELFGSLFRFGFLFYLLLRFRYTIFRKLRRCLQIERFHVTSITGTCSKACLCHRNCASTFDHCKKGACRSLGCGVFCVIRAASSRRNANGCANMILISKMPDRAHNPEKLPPAYYGVPVTSGSHTQVQLRFHWDPMSCSEER